jgi:hypothetical protein
MGALVPQGGDVMIQAGSRRILRQSESGDDNRRAKTRAAGPLDQLGYALTPVESSMFAGRWPTPPFLRPSPCWRDTHRRAVPSGYPRGATTNGTARPLLQAFSYPSNRYNAPAPVRGHPRLALPATTTTGRGRVLTARRMSSGSSENGATASRYPIRLDLSPSPAGTKLRRGHGRGPGCDGGHHGVVATGAHAP